MKICDLAGKCPGCSLWGVVYDQQLTQKQQRLAELFSDLINIDQIQCHSSGEYGLRQRFDFVIQQNQLGLIDKNKNFIAISDCLQLTDSLKKAFQILSQVSFDIRIGTIRLRESSLGQVKKFGLWLDFANVDIKNILLEKQTLKKLSEYYFIEVGQKKKCLDQDTFEHEQIKLAEPFMQPWFHTFNYKTKTPINLYCAVSSFTQPSAQSAKLITDIITQWVSEESLNIWEFGCGIGQYTFPLLSLNHKVSVFENDEFALQCVQKTAVENSLTDNLKIYAGDFQNSHAISDKDSADIILVNPPKSGLKKFTETIIQVRPKKIIYVSCYPETLRTDSDTFLQHGYKIKSTHIVDQFPQTAHFEVVMLFERIDI